MNSIESALYEGYRDPVIIRHLRASIQDLSKKIGRTVPIMEVCGGHTHTIAKYGLGDVVGEAIEFIHGPGCPVCIMPKERIDEAAIIACQENVILVTLGDMIKVPGSQGSLQNIRAQGADVRFVYSPSEILKIATENPTKTVVYFAIGFETTTPMTAALLERCREKSLSNVLFHINHVTVPEPVRAIMDSGEARIEAFLGPSHVSVITGAKIYAPLVKDYHTPIVVSGFEPVDVLSSCEMILRQISQGRAELEIEYTRSVTMEGNTKAQELIDKYFTRAPHFRWRGIGDIPYSAWELREEYSEFDARRHFSTLLPTTPIDDHKLCICGEILRGLKKPYDCKIFGTACTPSHPMGSCMVSSEGACAAYFKYKS